MKTLKDWRPVVADLLTRLQGAGFTLHSVDDGGERIELQPDDAHAVALEAILSVDDSHLYLSHPEREKRDVLYIVLDEVPFDIIADGSSWPVLNAVCDEFSAAWEDKPCPRKGEDGNPVSDAVTKESEPHSIIRPVTRKTLADREAAILAAYQTFTREITALTNEVSDDETLRNHPHRVYWCQTFADMAPSYPVMDKAVRAAIKLVRRTLP